ncbi:MAG: hypothetical protein EFT35_08475 [Methanophagales archaeon ANME-1-THS]|nr:MAG: hypothetical protein EFT35_08475 [Methanophagales archaeon ANME-1-THS]
MGTEKRGKGTEESTGVYTYTAKRAGTGLIERGFAQRIAERYSPLKLFTLNFAPLLVRTRIRPRMRRFELIYALPHLVLRREIAHSFSSSTLSTPITRLWHIALELALTLKFPLTRSPCLVAAPERALQAVREKESNLTIDRITGAHTISSSSIASLQTPYVIHTPASISSKNHARYYTLSCISKSLSTPPLSYYFCKLVPGLLSQKPARAHRGAHSSLHRYERLESDTLAADRTIIRAVAHDLPLRTLSTPASNRAPGRAVYPLYTPSGMAYSAPLLSLYSRESARVGHVTAPEAREPLRSPHGRLEKDEGENRLASAINFAQPPKQELAAAEPGSMATNYPLFGAPLRPPAVSAQESAQKSSHAHEFGPITSYFKWLTPNHLRSPASEGGRMIPLYHSYPGLEHHTAVRIEVVKERVVEKVSEKPPQATPQPPSIDVNRLADQVYHFIERRVRIERERRGL